MSLQILTRQDYDTLDKAVDSQPARRPVYVEAGHLRALLAVVNRDALPDENEVA